jgi:hypothetical protein
LARTAYVHSLTERRGREFNELQIVDANLPARPGLPGLDLHAVNPLGLARGETAIEAGATRCSVPASGRWGKRRMIELYHQTTKAAARRILAEGFRDGRGVHPAIGPWTGVWLSDHARARPAGVRGRALLVIDLALPAAALATYETVADRPADRAFLLPAALVNEAGRIRRIDPVGVANGPLPSRRGRVRLAQSASR